MIQKGIESFFVKVGEPWHLLRPSASRIRFVYQFIIVSQIILWANNRYIAYIVFITVILFQVDISQFVTPGFTAEFIEVLKILENQNTEIKQKRAFRRFVRDYGTKLQ